MSRFSSFPKLPASGAESLSAWMHLATAYSQMSLAAAEVIMRRTAKMATGAMPPGEMMGMVMEKATAFAEASEQMAVAAAAGNDPARIAAAALKPYSRRTRSNVRKYRR